MTLQPGPSIQFGAPRAVGASQAGAAQRALAGGTDLLGMAGAAGTSPFDPTTGLPTRAATTFAEAAQFAFVQNQFVNRLATRARAQAEATIQQALSLVERGGPGSLAVLTSPLFTQLANIRGQVTFQPFEFLAGVERPAPFVGGFGGFGQRRQQQQVPQQQFQQPFQRQQQFQPFGGGQLPPAIIQPQPAPGPGVQQPAGIAGAGLPGFGDIFGGAGEFFGGAAGDIGEFFGELGGDIGGFFGDVGGGVSDFFGGAFGAFGDIFGGGGDLFGGVTGTLGSIGEFLNDPFAGLFGAPQAPQMPMQQPQTQGTAQGQQVFVEPGPNQLFTGTGVGQFGFPVRAP